MNTNSKAAILGRISKIRDATKRAREDLHRSTSSTVSSYKIFESKIEECETQLTLLSEEIAATVKDEVSPPKQFNQETFAATSNMVRKAILSRFGNFPMAAAMVEMVILFFESEMRFTTHIRSIHKEAMAEDRSVGNPSSYDVNGEPKTKSS